MQHVIETQNVPTDRLWLWRSRCTSLAYQQSEERCQGASTRWTSRHSRAAAAVTSWSARMSEPDQEDSPTTEIPPPPDAAPRKPTNKYILVSTIFNTLARKTHWMWVQPADVAVIKWFSQTSCIAICWCNSGSYHGTNESAHMHTHKHQCKSSSPSFRVNSLARCHTNITGEKLSYDHWSGMWQQRTRNVGQCPTWWSPCQIKVAPSVQRRKVYLTPNTRVPCSNAAKTRNPLKFAGVAQTNETISAASGPKFTILWGTCGRDIAA